SSCQKNTRHLPTFFPTPLLGAGLRRIAAQRAATDGNGSAVRRNGPGIAVRLEKHAPWGKAATNDPFRRSSARTYGARTPRPGPDLPPAGARINPPSPESQDLFTH